MKQTLRILLFFCSVNFAQAQTSGQITMNQYNSNSGAEAQLSYLLGPIADRDKKMSAQTDFGIQGSAFTSDKLLPGKVFYGSDFEGNVFYRYNAYHEEIEISDIDLPGAPMRPLLRDKKIRLISSNGNEMTFKTFIDKKRLTQNGYLTKLHDGKYSLYKRTHVKYTPGQKPPNSLSKPIPARFSKFYEYYMEIKGVNRIVEIELRKRKLLKSLPYDKKEKTAEFIKKNKIKIRNEYDLFKVMEFLNEN